LENGLNGLADVAIVIFGSRSRLIKASRVTACRGGGEAAGRGWGGLKK
jgi:hypothetical protein